MSKPMVTVEPRLEEVTIVLPHRLAENVRAYTRRYQTSFSGMVNLVLSYYFGDGSDHLRCESCDLYYGQACMMELEEGSQLNVFGGADHRTLT